jgi:fructose/tagatose bisphosphate aldolase
MNVRFTRRAVEVASTFGVPVEGEVGSMDPHARRRTSRTLIGDLREFVERTEVAYVGLNAGQVHGSDYDYRRSRRAMRDIEDLDRVHGADDPRSLSQACVELDAGLAAAGVDARQPDRRCLLRIRERLIVEPRTAAEAVLAEAYASVPTACWRLLGQLEQAWQQRRLAVATRRSALYRLVASGGGLEPGRGQQRFLDLDLLRQANAAVAGTGTRLVLHGGSSVAYEELPMLRTLGVARLNVGSRPFQAFLRALESSCPTPVRLDDTWDVVRFLAEYAADWRRWLAEPPSFLTAYQDELRRRYFIPLLG